MGIDAFTTDRLDAERLRPEHLGDYLAMNRDPQVMATLGGVRTEAEARRMFARNLDHWERHGFGLWVFRDRTDGRFAGRAGLRHVVVGGDDEVELAYAFMSEFWGRGLATEAARALLPIAFGPLGLESVVGFTLRINHASRRVMEKAGFTFEREVIHVGLPHVLFRTRLSS